MTPELEPLEEDVLALLREARAIHDLEPAAKAAILHDVETRIGVLPPPTGGGSGARQARESARPGVATSAASLGGAKLVIALAATFALGVATGLGVAPSRTANPAPPAAPVALSPAPITSAARDIELPDLPEPPAVISAPAVAAPPRFENRAPPAVSARGLAAERGLLDVARVALARGDATEALTAVERHRREYPEGVLVEEREALAVKALVALGRRDEARARAEQFERRFPNGLMLPAVKGVVRP